MVWSVGATLAQSIFDGGLRKAQNDQAAAAYDVTVAQYRQTVLVSLQEVEDQLAALRVLDQESVVLNEAVKAAQDAEQIALNQYKAGTAQFLTVITAQALALNNERALVQLQGLQFTASVALITTIGGGWTDLQNAGHKDSEHQGSGHQDVGATSPTALKSS
jgi:outer membrane protein TolC